MVNLEYGAFRSWCLHCLVNSILRGPEIFKLIFEAESEKLFWCLTGRTVLEGVISLQQLLLPGLLLVFDNFIA